MTISNQGFSQSTEVAAIQRVFEQLVQCWNNADGVAYGALFTADADYVDVTGTRTKAGEAIGRLHQFLFNGPLKGSRLESNSDKLAEEVSFLGPDVAVVIHQGTSRLQGQTQAPDDRNSINTNVLVKRNGEWKIRAFQNNRIQPQSFGPPTGTGAPGQNRK